MKLTWLLCFSGILIFSASLLEAQLINVDFNNDSFGAGHGGPNPGPTMSGAAVLGTAGDQWNGINVSSGTGIPLIYANGSNSPVTMTFTSGGGYDANSFGGSTPFASTSYDALMEDYLFTGGTPRTITLSGLAPDSFYNLVLYNAADQAAARRITLFTVNSNTQTSTWNASSSALIAGTDYVEFKPALSDASGNLVITWTGNGSAEGDINGFQLQSVPMPPMAPPVTQISAGTGHVLFLKSDGSLWGMGYNVYGELGDGTFNNQFFPEQILGGQVGVIAAGGNDVLGQSLFGEFHPLFGPGSLWTMGGNDAGQLGDGTTVNTNTPQEIVTSAFGNAVSAVSAGGRHSLYIRPGGSLWAMGNNQSGQLGNGTFNEQHVPQQIVAGNVVAIAAGTFHSLFIKSDGSLWGMGLNGGGELGDGTFTERKVPEQILASNVVAVAAGYYYSLFLKSDGSLWGMGGNSGQPLGVSGFTFTNIPVRIVPGAIFNGGFEMGDFSDWTTNGNFSFTGIATKGAYAHSGRFGVQLGSVGSLGYISQPLGTTPGTRYLVSFWLDSPDGEAPQ